VLDISSAGRSFLESTLVQFQKLGFGGRFIDDERTLLWSKLVFLAPSALSTTAADKPAGGIISDPEWRRLWEACVREACAVGVAEGAKVDAGKCSRAWLGWGQ
jgi:ketopantoate reductase